MAHHEEALRTVRGDAIGLDEVERISDLSSQGVTPFLVCAPFAADEAGVLQPPAAWLLSSSTAASNWQ